MLVDFSKVDHTYLVCGFTDLRKGIDGLASLIQSHYQLDLYDNAVFLFGGRRTDRFKALHFDARDFFSCINDTIVGNSSGPERKRKSLSFLLGSSAGYLTDFQLINNRGFWPQPHGLYYE